MNFIIVNLFLLLYFFLVSFYTINNKGFKITFKKNILKKRLNQTNVLILTTTGSFALTYIMAFYSDIFLFWYVRLVFILLSLMGALWIWFSNTSKHKNLVFLILIFAISRFIYPNFLTHNLFVIFSIFWIAPVLQSYNLMSKKGFIWLTIGWFVYDLSFVWLTSLSETTFAQNESTGFPLGIFYKNLFIGSGDLIWGAFLLSLIKDISKYYVSVILVFINLLISFVFFNILQIHSIPLITFWGPIGLLILFYFYNKPKKGFLGRFFI
ncbi:hypothetical protein COV24_02870 [candidate division WWE3 bacterium CG10_big_fil_rev_8_21_14_0_10_32_10]|uniref:Uncharacterized protein n=1 Tax=candidate division WWE3 bacterium CG10_big_fil_rev_8_21_14_0_10_32_10 TaxID=1975090 RepID=A0A2H0RBG2_UNCKA|nr:MAG: hypothetical protein COV24_02870 [candidate division WWE3 bacterium CG10_big_fil_rev_8_21_14_0_10_32_10]